MNLIVEICMEFTLDRIEDGVAVLLDSDHKAYECDPCRLPGSAGAGDVFTCDVYPDSPDFAPVPLPGIRQERALRIKGLFEKLKNKNTDIER